MWSSNARSGFTLLEAVVALMIIGLVSISALAAVGTQLRAEERARRATEVAALAEDRLAVVHLLTADELQSLPDTVAHGQFPPPFNQYTWSTTSTPVLGEEYLNDVNVTLEWPNGSYTLASRVYIPPTVTQADGGSGTGGGGAGGGANGGAGGSGGPGGGR
jgi:prepilin-type N-terminal cleavage/methylation domain-containing protein